MKLIDVVEALLEYDDPMEESEIEFIGIILKRIEDGKEIVFAEESRIREICEKYNVKYNI